MESKIFDFSLLEISIHISNHNNRSKWLPYHKFNNNGSNRVTKCHISPKKCNKQTNAARTLHNPDVLVMIRVNRVKVMSKLNVKLELKHDVLRQKYILPLCKKLENLRSNILPRPRNQREYSKRQVWIRRPGFGIEQINSGIGWLSNAELQHFGSVMQQ